MMNIHPTKRLASLGIGDQFVRTGSWRHILSFVLILALILPVTASPAFAGDRIELAIHGGYRSGIVDLDFSVACIAAQTIGPCPDSLRGEDDVVYGLTVDIPIARQWMIEVRLDRHDAFARLPSPLLNFGTEPPTVELEGFDLEVTSLLVGGLRWWRVGNVEPFVSLSAGVADISIGGTLFGEPTDLLDRHFMAAAGGGVKLRPESRVGARIELRGLWFDLPSDFSETDFVRQVGRDTAAELSIGAIIRF